MNPNQPMRWPSARSASTQVQQIKAAGIAVAPLSSIPQAQSPNTQGLPQVVTGVTVTKKILTATSCQLTVAFTRDPGDPYFTQAKVYLKVGNGTPTFVTEGNASPLAFTTARSKMAGVVFVISEGNWGSTALVNSPSRAISLA